MVSVLVLGAAAALDSSLPVAQHFQFRLSAVRKSVTTAHVYEVRPRKDHRGVALISDALPFGCGTASQTQSATQSDMRNSTANNALRFAFTMHRPM